MFQKIWFRALLIIAVGFSAYSFMLCAPFKTLDDQFSIVANPLLRDTKHVKEIFSQGYFNDHSYYRPLVNLSYMAEYQAFGLKSFYYNLDNLILHILNTFLVWTLIALLTGCSSTGFWVALLFILHPLQVEAVSNISGRAILLGTFFVMSSFILFLLYQRGRNAAYFFGSLLCSCIALFCKESSAILPGVLFLYLWMKRKPFGILWPWALIITGFITLRHGLGITQTFAWRNMTEYILGFVTFLRSVLTDIRLLFFPVDLHFDRSQALFSSFHESSFVTTVFVWIVIVIWIAIACRHFSPWVWFCLGWVVLEMLPVSQVVTTIGVGPGVISAADHFLYLALIPIFLLIVQGFRKFYAYAQAQRVVQSAILKFAVAGFFMFLWVMNVEQNTYASNELAMLRRSLQIQPFNARIQYSVGLNFALSGYFDKAEHHFRQAIIGDPMSPRYKISYAKSICDQERYQECLSLYNEIADAGGLEELLANNKKAAQQLLLTHDQILPK